MQIKHVQNLQNHNLNFGINIKKDKEFHQALDEIKKLGANTDAFVKRLEEFKLPQDLLSSSARKINEDDVTLVFYPIEYIHLKDNYSGRKILYDPYEKPSHCVKCIQYGFFKKGNNPNNIFYAKTASPLRVFGEIVNDYIRHCTRY